jgi:hypothetical protein
MPPRSAPPAKLAANATIPVSHQQICTQAIPQFATCAKRDRGYPNSDPLENMKLYFGAGRDWHQSTHEKLIDCDLLYRWAKLALCSGAAFSRRRTRCRRSLERDRRARSLSELSICGFH